MWEILLQIVGNKTESTLAIFKKIKQHIRLYTEETNHIANENGISPTLFIFSVARYFEKKKTLFLSLTQSPI